MTIRGNEEQVKFLNNLFFTDQKIERCNDATISFYRVLDKPFTWNIFNAKSFLSTIERQKIVPETENHINMFLYHILRTLNVIVFGTYRDSIFTQRLSDHLNTFIELVSLSDVYVCLRAAETLKLLCSKCDETYSKLRQHTLLTDIHLESNHGNPKEYIVIQLTLTDKITGVITVLTFNLFL